MGNGTDFYSFSWSGGGTEFEFLPFHQMLPGNPAIASSFFNRWSTRFRVGWVSIWSNFLWPHQMLFPNHLKSKIGKRAWTGRESNFCSLISKYLRTPLLLPKGMGPSRVRVLLNRLVPQTQETRVTYWQRSPLKKKKRITYFFFFKEDKKSEWNPQRKGWRDKENRSGDNIILPFTELPLLFPIK